MLKPPDCPPVTVAAGVQGSPPLHAPQSLEHEEHVSVPLHVPSPHTGPQLPQSLAQEEQVSPDSQEPFPQTGPLPPPPRALSFWRMYADVQTRPQFQSMVFSFDS